MTPTSSQADLPAELLDRVMNLTPAGKSMLLDLLLLEREEAPASSDDVRQAWKDEIARRIHDVVQGKVEFVEGEEVIRRLQLKQGDAEE